MYNAGECEVKQTGKTFFRYFLILILSVAAATGLMILLYCIPTTPIKENVWRSHPVYDYEGSYPQWAAEYKMTQLDNVTDGYMLLEAMCAGSGHPVPDAMNNPYTVYPDVNPDKAAVLESHNTPGASGTGWYGRYWHGYLLLLKPLLLLFEVSDLRIMNMMLCLGLSFYLFFLIEKMLGRKALVAAMISWFVLNPVSIIMSFQFSTTFYVMTIASILVLKKHEWLCGKGRYGLFFLVIGIVTNFIDFLTYPLVGMAVPMIFAVLMKERYPFRESLSHLSQDREKERSVWRLAGECILESASWGIGYAGMWFGKWVAGSILTGENFILNALSEAQVQSIGQEEIFGTVVSPAGSILKNLRVVVKWPFVLLLFLLLLYICIGLFKGSFFLERSGLHGSTPALLLLAAYPFVWFSVLQAHSISCYWFTYRNLCVTVLAVLLLAAQRLRRCR